MAKAAMATETSSRRQSNNIVTKKVQATGQFYRDTKLEMKRVTWPTREEVVQTTIVTIVVVFFFGYFLWATNWALSTAVHYIISFLSN